MASRCQKLPRNPNELYQVGYRRWNQASVSACCAKKDSDSFFFFFFWLPGQVPVSPPDGPLGDETLGHILGDLLECLSSWCGVLKCSRC